MNAATAPLYLDYLNAPDVAALALKKTIVFVTHDIDEALKIGDRIAILRNGALVQYDTPQAILARPADAFVESFVGADRALKRLALIRCDAALEPAGNSAGARSIGGDANLRDALAAMLAAGVDSLAVRDAGGAVQGIVTLAGVRARTLTGLTCALRAPG